MIEYEKNRELFKEPNTVTQWYGLDQPGEFKFGKEAVFPYTRGIYQYTNWDEKPFSYHWNSLGLRGPEPDYNADTKILFAGGSLTAGVGLPIECSFAHVLSEMLGASYINLSDVVSMTDLLEGLKKFKDFNPNFVILNAPSFITAHHVFLTKEFYENKEFYRKHSVPMTLAESRKAVADADYAVLRIYEYAIKQMFPNARIILSYFLTRSWEHMPVEYDFMEVYVIRKFKLVDLARDNKHPGIQSHKNIATGIFNLINS